jgi:hypothetical protein
MGTTIERTIEREKVKEYVMITAVGRLSYVYVFEKNPYMDPEQWSCVYLIPKTDEQGVKDIKAEINKAVEKGIRDGKFTQEDALKPSFGNPLHDGDKEEGKGPEYKGHYYLNTKNGKTAPDVVGPDAKPLMKQSDIYSGCYGRVDINFSAYNNKNKGVGVYLNNVMKVDDGPRLDGKQSGEDAFSKFAQNAPSEGDLE